MSISLNGARKFLRKKLVVMDLFNLPINEFKKAINQEKIPNNFTHLNKIISCKKGKYRGL